jgi:hypothetical protein
MRARDTHNNKDAWQIRLLITLLLATGFDPIQPFGSGNAYVDLPAGPSS